MKDHYQTDEEILKVVEGFEECTTSKAEFTHLSHLTVATYYLCNSTPDETFRKMRFGLLRFLDHHAVDTAKYSDRITWIWIKRIQDVLENMDPTRSLLTATNAVLEHLSNSSIPSAGDHEDRVSDTKTTLTGSARGTPR
jgi:hypothetical protein